MHHDMETKEQRLEWTWSIWGENIIKEVFSNKDTDCKLPIKLYMLRLASTKYALRWKTCDFNKDNVT